MATRSAMRTAVKRRLGNRTDITNADLDKWLDDAILDLGTRRIHFEELESTDGTITTAVDVDAYSLPSANTFAVMYVFDTVNKRVLDRWSGSMESLIRARLVHESAATDLPTHFLEYGDKIHVYPTAQSILTINVYTYDRPTMAAGDTAEPNFNIEWHYPIEILAAKHGHHDLGDDGRAQVEEQRWMEWLTQRDSGRRHRARFNVPQKGVGIHPATHSPRTGV